MIALHRITPLATAHLQARTLSGGQERGYEPVILSLRPSTVDAMDAIGEAVGNAGLVADSPKAQAICRRFVAEVGTSVCLQALEEGWFSDLSRGNLRLDAGERT